MSRGTCKSLRKARPIRFTGGLNDDVHTRCTLAALLYIRKPSVRVDVCNTFRGWIAEQTRFIDNSISLAPNVTRPKMTLPFGLRGDI